MLPNEASDAGCRHQIRKQREARCADMHLETQTPIALSSANKAWLTAYWRTLSFLYHESDNCHQPEDDS